MPCIIVRRGDFRQYDRLYRAFGDRLPVVWDQRRTQPTGVDAGDMLGEDRRHAPPLSWVTLGFVVVDRSKA
jgi:hypothetical protein